MEFLEEICLKLKEVDISQVEEAVKLIKEAKMVFLAGNGGSSAIASHFTNDLAKIGKIKAVCLSDNTPLLTAWSNDDSYEQAFSRQLENLGQTGDVLILISSSGRSPNILKAAEKARETGIKIIGLVGFDGGDLSFDAKLYIPSNDYGVVESCHSALCHLIVKML